MGDLDINGLHSIDQQSVLERMSGHPLVNGEVYGFRYNGNGNRNIIVNGKPTSCFVDQRGRIGSAAHGGPGIFQWLAWFGHSHRDVMVALKAVFPEFVRPR